MRVLLLLNELICFVSSVFPYFKKSLSFVLYFAVRTEEMATMNNICNSLSAILNSTVIDAALQENAKSLQTEQRAVKKLDLELLIK
jgi:hypothetical protein